MPKVKGLKMTNGAIRARKRREADREEHRYNTTLKEFVQYRYSNIIDEFNPFYQELKSKYPEKHVYINTKEFRLWRKREIKETFKNDGIDVVSFDSGDLQGQQLDDDEQQQQRHDEQGHHEQQQQQQHHGEHHIEQEQQQQRLDDSEQQQHNAIEQAINDVDAIIREIENGGVPLQPLQPDDEGIDLDIFEEIHGDIEDFNYRLEVELNQW